MGDNYKVEGSGKTIRTADKSLEQGKSALARKLKDAKVSRKLEVIRTYFESEHQLKDEIEDDSYLKSFSVNSSESWSDAAEKAKAHADIKQYDATYTVRQFIKLTSEQKDALSGKKKKGGPTAERQRADSSYDLLSRLR